MISTILLSGGTGSRSGKEIPKQYCYILGKRIINYCLDELISAGLTDELVIVFAEEHLALIEEILDDYKHKFSEIKFVIGGKTRQESVYNGLKSCSFNTIILHESARPLITAENLRVIVESKDENVTMGLDIPFTVLKYNKDKISDILDRNELFNVQLPQKFNKVKLLEAHEKAIKEERSFTDDSSLLFHYNNIVAVIKGSEENIKITSPGDFKIAEEILISRKKS